MNDDMWRAIVCCDASYDGQFYYGLITTGIFCRPSCKSRTPRRENVRIFNTPAEAIGAGLRPCKRCRPDVSGWRSPEEELARKLTELITASYRQPLTLSEMARRLYVSPFYLQRSFKRVMKVSPVQYLKQVRLNAAKQLLAQTEETVSEIARKVGFRSSTHFASVFQRETRHTPTAYRRLYGQLHPERTVQR
ncbi:MAG: methylphosphotriester-DNA--protein-cysteine methyltransferase family protein [Brevibacillus sp.]|nr:methylphosphotriester-DNA--protein-cysteine methyltransferase family protein [Brevibacillus sp.]